ncbi:MAG: serine/threonine-protein kinase [Mariniblastus sp.]|nr:serine/threonine-protein kinase [Mariniblastus sp.]
MSIGRDFIGPFQLLRLIRAGTSTQVWEALRTGGDERIALKVLMKNFRKDKYEIQQLKHEATVGADLDHENVIKIFGYHNDQGFPLISMQLFYAKNLKIAMRENHAEMYPNVSVIIRKCALGLKHMHDKGWIHCDVKPDNFLADAETNVKLIDFSIGVREKKKGGIGKLFGSGRPKSIRGTRSYMAPEQIRRKNPGAPADIYGLGCVIFELLSGKTPYSANSPDELLTKHLSATIPSLEAYSDATKEFADLVRRMLTKDPAKRIQTMDDFLHEFDRIQMFRPGKRPEGFRKK